MSSIKPVARTVGEAAQAKNDLNFIVEQWAIKNADNIKRSCANCVYAVMDGPFKCSKYGVTPPINVIMNGCDGHFDHDDIPF